MIVSVAALVDAYTFSEGFFGWFQIQPAWTLNSGPLPLFSAISQSANPHLALHLINFVNILAVGRAAWSIVGTLE